MNPDLIEKLASEGVLTDDWRMAFLGVPRSEFLPDVLWELRQDDLYHPVDRGTDLKRWFALANGEAQVVTQVDDGQPAGSDGLGEAPTSSASMPHMVALMLKHLKVHGGERVLEIGTGTGWNAALLAQFLGAGRVNTIEIDPEIAKRARKALDAAGFGQVNVIVGNGSHGHLNEAPYHRVISTASCQTVPYSWVEQTRPGGRIVTPWAPSFSNWALIALDVRDDGTATGGVVAPANFMRLRDQRLEPWWEATNHQTPMLTYRTTLLTPAELVLRGDVLMALSAWLPDIQARYSPPARATDGAARLYLSHPRTRSWAYLRAHPDSTQPHRVIQCGTRSLFDEVEGAHDLWVREGRPGTDSWQITVDGQGQRVELMC